MTNFLTHVELSLITETCEERVGLIREKALKDISVSVRSHRGISVVIRAGECVKTIQDSGSWPEPRLSKALNTGKDRWASMGNYTIIALEC